MTYRDDSAPLSEDEMQDALRDYDGVLATLGDRFSSDIFRKVGMPRCKMLANFGVGYNHIDVDAAKAAGLQVSNTPGAVTDATADIAMTLMLMAARRAGEGERLVRSGEWSGWEPSDGQNRRDRRNGADRPSGCATLSLRLLDGREIL